MVGSVGVCAISDRTHLLFSQMGFCLYPLKGVVKKDPLEISFALPSLLSMLSLLHTQWAAGTVAHSRPHKKASRHSSYNSSTGMFVGGVDVGFSQNEI